MSSIFIGGGTPSCIKPVYIWQIMETIRKSFSVMDDAECTIECNPGTVSYDGFSIYRQSGINRISFGLQSTSDDMLKKLGRIHTYKDFVAGFDMAEAVGFSNINIDLMLGLPGQSLELAREDVQNVCIFGASHISAYSLIIEEGTPYFDIYNSGKEVSHDMRLPSEDMERGIYYECRDILAKNGYAQYEISNYARAGYECKHNVGYWIRRNYVGFGLGASSLFNEKRWTNTSIFSEYIADSTEKTSIKRDLQALSVEDQMEETMFLGLRLKKGVNKADFAKIFGREIFDISEYKNHTINMIKDGLLEDDGNNLKLTEKGFDFANTVMSGYIID